MVAGNVRERPADRGPLVSIVLRDREVARCKYVLTGAHANPVLGELAHGQLDILALEVAVPMRRKGVGRRAVQAIRDQNPLPHMTALIDGAESRKFWVGIGRIRHEPAHAFLRGIERVTYSEPRSSVENSRTSKPSLTQT